MKSFAVLCLAVLAIAVGVHSAPSQGKTNDTLVLLHTLFRHGNRTPDSSSLYPNDPYINSTYAPYGYGQLTTKGKLTEYNIGRYIRETYNDFIPAQYTPDVYYAISTNYKRTKMSLQLVLAGLFPPSPDQEFVAGLNWQPLPANVELSHGVIGVASAYCANYINTYNGYAATPQAKSEYDQYKLLYAYVEKNSGRSIKNPTDALNIYVTLQSQESLGWKLPAWAKAIYPNPLQKASVLSYAQSSATPALQKFTAGFLLKKILDDSQQKIDGVLSAERKIFLYSAHDYDVAVVLNTLGLLDWHEPNYGATIFFEIHQINGVNGLKLLYQNYNSADGKPVLLTIPGCSEVCALDQLRELIKDSLPGPNDVCEYTTELA